MRRVLIYLLMLCGVLMTPMSVAQPSIQVDLGSSSAEARFMYLRLELDEQNGWQIRGRLARADKSTKVPEGQVLVVAVDAKGDELALLRADYKPAFVHRKTDRASYFTVPVPDEVITLVQRFWISHQKH